MRTHPFLSAAVSRGFALALLACTGTAAATDFPVSGSITFNGNTGELPAGGVFGDATWDSATGLLSSGRFTFPQTSVTVSVPGFGNVDVTYELSQTNTSTAQVASDGVAAMSEVMARLEVLSISVPISITPCVFEPIPLDLAGTGSATGLDLSDPGFAIPLAPTGNCGVLRDQINDAIAGSSNSMQLLMSGDFSPPDGSDVIFTDGFDPAG